jgi:hypothetical protein
MRSSAIQIENSLAPFLYYTPTIQQWIAPYAPNPRQRRHASSRPADIPFDQSSLNGRVDSPAEPLERRTRSTISGKDKRVFAKLLDPSYDPQADLRARGKAPKSRQTTPKPRSAIGERQFSDADLQAKHEALMRAKRRASALHQERLNELQAERGMEPTFFEETEELRQKRAQNLARAREDFRNAETDKDLWYLLSKWAFSGVQKHFALPPQLEQHNSAKQEPAAAKDKTANNELAILTHNYPLLLVSFLEELRDSFPTSQLAFSLLPMIKSLGRQSYVLGASTPLYNSLIDATWRTFSDFPRINDLLLEMENAGLEFDYDTLDVLDKIRRQGERIQKGDKGELMKRIWELDSVISGWDTVTRWIPKVKARLEAEALRRANENESESDSEDLEDDSISGSEEDWGEELSAMQEQQEALRRAAASLG